MKKLFKLFLCSLMFITLTACGKEEPHVHQQLLDYIDTNNYEDAIKYINDLAYEYQKENQQTIQQDSIETLILGEWVYIENTHYDFKDFKTMIFKDNYTVECDGKEYLWKVENQGTSVNDLDYIDVKILDGASEYIRFTYERDDCDVSLGQYNGDSGYAWNNVRFFHISDYEKVDITLDNWSNFYEIYDEPKWAKNSFDEIDKLWIYRYIKLKDEYASKMPSVYNNLAIEYSAPYSQIEVSVDWDNKTYTLGNIIKTNDYVNTSSSKLSFRTLDNDERIFGVTFNSVQHSKDGSIDFINYYYKDIEFTRVEGTIYIKK